MPKSYLYLIEFYQRTGNINFAWVRATNQDEAQKLLRGSIRDNKGMLIDYDETIMCGQHMHKHDLAMKHEALDLDDKEHLVSATLQYILDVMIENDSSPDKNHPWIPGTVAPDVRRWVKHAMEY